MLFSYNFDLLPGAKEHSWFLLCCSNNTVDRRPLSPASLSKCENLLMRLAQFYKYHGINIKTCYADFDKHHIGVVTESQVGTNNYHQFVDPANKIWNPLLNTPFFFSSFTEVFLVHLMWQLKRQFYWQRSTMTTPGLGFVTTTVSMKTLKESKMVKIWTFFLTSHSQAFNITVLPTRMRRGVLPVL